MLRPHLLKREDVLYWLCRVSSISNKTANEITLCDVNIQDLLTADLAQSKRVISHHCDPFPPGRGLDHDFGGTSGMCVVTSDRHKKGDGS